MVVFAFNPSTGRQRQADLFKQASLIYVGVPIQPGLCIDPISKKGGAKRKENLIKQ